VDSDNEALSRVEKIVATLEDSEGKRAKCGVKSLSILDNSSGNVIPMNLP
jgi:hypothetical protein